MTPVSATGHVHLQLARSSFSTWRQRRSTQRVAGDVFARGALGPHAAAAQGEGLYGLAQRWPAWARLLVIGGLGVGVWASVILTALSLAR